VSAAQLLLRRLLDQAGGAAETGYLLVIDGEGLENLPGEMPTPKGAYQVHRVSTELGLRHLLWKAKGAPLIAVMPEPLAHKIQKSPDLLRRARNQRVHALSVNDVLEVVLGVRVVGADAPYMQQLALQHVDKLSLAMSRRTLPTVVDRKLLTELLVDASVGEQVRTRTPAELLAGWVIDPPDWDDNVRELVSGALPTLHGDQGRLLAWALLELHVRFRQLVVYGALLTVDATELPQPAWGPLWQAAKNAPIEMEDRRILRRSVAALAEEALECLGERAAPLLSEADKTGRECLTPSQLQTSRVLPLALADRCHFLARSAAEGKAIEAADIAWLTRHRAAKMHQADLGVLEAMAKLSRYLNQPAPNQLDVLGQISNYQRQSAFADLACLQLRRALAGCATYHVEANKVLAAVRERRDRENRNFAEALVTGYESSVHREGITPLHRIWRRVVAPLWQQHGDAKVFLVVLDGCSYPIFLELLYELAQDAAFPVGLQTDDDGLVVGIPALSPLPTVTSHARGAIFLGELPQDPLVAETVFRDRDEARTDKARFNQNAALKGRTRKLFLKGDLGDGGQELLRSLDADSGIDVVGVVFNAVDDQIGSSNTGAKVRLAPEDITAFKPSLHAALRAGRKVLLTADHGHSPFVSKSLRAGAGKAPRYLQLEKHEAPPEGFIEIDLAGLGGPAEKRAFAWKCGAYLGNPQVGFHGGCGLEEMVVPLAWLEHNGLHADEPSWWYGGGVVQEVRTPMKLEDHPLVTPLPPRKVAAKAKPQLSLFDPAEKADTLPLDAAVLDSLSRDEKAVLVLLKENGSARASELADRLNKNPGRLNGLMRTLRRSLHKHGIVMFTDENLPSGETLYRYQPPEAK